MCWLRACSWVGRGERWGGSWKKKSLACGLLVVLVAFAAFRLRLLVGEEGGALEEEEEVGGLPPELPVREPLSCRCCASSVAIPGSSVLWKETLRCRPLGLGWVGEEEEEGV